MDSPLCLSLAVVRQCTSFLIIQVNYVGVCPFLILAPAPAPAPAPGLQLSAASGSLRELGPLPPPRLPEAQLEVALEYRSDCWRSHATALSVPVRPAFKVQVQVS